MSTPAVDVVAAALVAASNAARWPDGSLVLDLDTSILRDLVAPHLHAALIPAWRRARLAQHEREEVSAPSSKPYQIGAL